MALKNNRKLVVIFLVFGIIVVAAIFLLVTSSGSKKNKLPNLDTGSYYDANSGQTVSNPPGKAPDTYGTPSGQPIYLGIGNLIDAGLSDDQIARLKTAFYNYSLQSKKNIKEVSINVKSIKSEPHDPKKNEPFGLDFNVLFDRKDTYKVQVQYTGLEDIRLRLINKQTSAQIYDSGQIGASPGE